MHAVPTRALVSAEAAAGNHAATVQWLLHLQVLAHSCHKAGTVNIAETSRGTHIQSVAVCQGHFRRRVLHAGRVVGPHSQNPGTVVAVTHVTLHWCQPTKSPVRPAIVNKCTRYGSAAGCCCREIHTRRRHTAALSTSASVGQLPQSTNIGAASPEGPAIGHSTP